MPSPRRRRPPQHRVRRERMPRAGMLLQVDGSHHAWLEQRGPRFALLLAVDDATGAVVHALFRPAEDARGYFLRSSRCCAAQASRSPSTAIATPSSGPPPSSAREARRRPSSRGRWRSWGSPDLRPLTAGQGPGGAHGGHVQDRLVTELRLASGRGASSASCRASTRAGRGPAARAGLAAARPGTRPRGHPRLPAHPQRRARQHRQVPLAHAAVADRSGPATPARASRCWSAQAASSRCATRARPSPPGSPRPARACCASAAPSWRSTRRWSASPRASAPVAVHPARRRTRLRPTALVNAAAPTVLRSTARRRAGSRFNRPSCRDSDARHRPAARHLTQHHQEVRPRRRPTRVPGCGIIYHQRPAKRTFSLNR